MKNESILKKEFHLQNLRKKKSLKKIGNLNFKIYNDQNEKINVMKKLFSQKKIYLSTLISLFFLIISIF